MESGFKKEISGGTAHKLPMDLQNTLLSSPKALLLWEDITPLARNEWICWVESVKREDTRGEHLERVVPELIGGKRRPCCWIGCVHRKDKVMSASQKYILGKKGKK
ncbi:MAG: YdeI/OmpD-associated family protein [Candidatus Zambryskibacteria bacterium]|nr:YdeI/OmpD-associated family protein [Candidatus Zambryskibacteria bacterium]